MITNMADYKRLLDLANLGLNTKSNKKEDKKNDINGSPAKLKTLEELMEEVSRIIINYKIKKVKDKMVTIKKQNLKAKRVINIAQFNPKGRVVVSRWEEVNPFIVSVCRIYL